MTNGKATIDAWQLKLREEMASDRCPCRYWVKRGRLDRIRGRVGR